MNLEHYFWYFQSAIPHRVCDDIVKYGQLSKKKESLGLTGELGVDRNAKDKPLSNKEMLNLKKKRDSNVVWMSDSWIHRAPFGAGCIGADGSARSRAGRAVFG